MNTTVQRVAGVVGTVLLSISLAACGGGGGGAAVPSGGGGGGGTGPSSSALQQPATQRHVAQESLATASGASTIAANLTGSGAASTIGIARRAAQALRRGTSAACTNDAETSITVNGQGQDVITVETFYDAACTEKSSLAVLTVTASTTTSITATGSITSYDVDGAVTQYDAPVTMTITESGTSETLTILMSVAPNATASAVAQLGVGCTVGTTSATCSVADVSHQASLSTDSAAALNVSASLAAQTVAISGSGSSYAGAYDALSVVPSGMSAFTIAGASASETFTLSGSSGTNGAGTLTVTDGTLGATVNMTVANGGSVTGTVVQTSTAAPVATFSVDAEGNGTITYGNGATGTVTAWVIVS